ncbi:hypothetical protein B1R27_34370 [Streptomyces sp. GKU 895]|nr:hypothetical protein B1R27_34370 [Streptomyces sp. GKU 895]
MKSTKNMKRLGLSAGALALGFSALVPTSPAQAAAGGTTFHLVNQATGKCLQMDWEGEKITQAKCKNTKKQWWGNWGGKLYSEYNRASWCMAHSGKEKALYARNCSDSQVWGWTSLKPNAKTSIASAKCGYLKVVDGKVKCGKRTGIGSEPGRKKMTWIIKY